MAASALVLLALAGPVAVLTGPLAANQVAAATGDTKHEPKGANRDGRNAAAVESPASTPTQGSEAETQPGAVSGEPAATHPNAAGPAVASGSGQRSVPVQIELSKPRAGQPSERADHASAASQGLHRGAGDDPDTGAGSAPAGTAATATAPSAIPSAGAQAATAPAPPTTSSGRSGGTPTSPPVIIEPPAAPQTNPPIATQPALTGARLDWILVGIVVSLAAAVVAAVRVATLRGRRPPR